MLVTVTMEVEWESIAECSVEQIQKYVSVIIIDGCEVNFAWARYVRVDIGGDIK